MPKRIFRRAQNKFSTPYLREKIQREKAGEIKAVSFNDRRLVPAQREIFKKAGWKKVDIMGDGKYVVWKSPIRKKK